MKKKLLSLVLCLMACMSITHAQTGIPYLPLKGQFGGAQVNDLTNFVPSLGDYTLELQGTKGTEIRIAFAGISYTPAETSTVRFTQKEGKVYVFENGLFKTILTPDSKYATSGDNIIQNPGFEQVEAELLATGRWKPTIWDTWNGGMPTWGGDTGKTNVREDAAYRSEGTKSIIMHSDSRQLLQELPQNSLEAGAHYLLAYDYWTSAGSGNGGITYQIMLRKDKYSNEFQTFSGHTTLESGTAKTSFSTLFQVAADVPESVWFVLQRNEDKVDWLDNFKLYKIIPENKGITGATSVAYLSGAAYAPGNLSFENGDYIDMTGRITNPGFDNNTTGWTLEANGSKISTAEKAGGLIPAGQNHLQFWVGSGGVTGKMYQTLTGLPNGKYTVKAAIAPAFSGTASLYANSGKTAVVSGTSKQYEVHGIVFDGTLEMGLEMATSGSPTIDIDDFKLFYLGIEAEGYLQVLQAKITEAKADTTAMHTATGRPGYHNLPQYRLALEKAVNRPDDEAATLTEALATLNEAITEYEAILEAYTPLKEAIDKLKVQLTASGYPVKTSFESVLAAAQAVYDSPNDQRAHIAASIQTIAEKEATLTTYKDLKTAIASATAILNSTSYAGKAAFQTAIQAAQAVTENPEGKDLSVAIAALSTAQTAYHNSQYTNPAVQQTVSSVDTSLKGSDKFVLRVDGKPFYMTNIQVRLDKLYGYEGWNDAALEAVVKRAAEDGFNTLSIPIHWREVEPVKDQFNWTILDKFMGWCKKYDVKMEMLWFSWSSGGRVQYLMNTGEKQTLRTPDYVCSLSGTSEFNMLRKEWEYSLDWRDTNLRNREKYVMGQIMEHIAVWDANNGNPHTVVGAQLGNEARNHGDNSATAAEIIEYYHHIGAGIKESKYVIWTRLNCVSWETPGRISANEAKRNSSTGTNIDFVGIDIYGTSASSILGNMGGQLPHTGKNYSMIMEIDAKDSNSPIYQMAALAGNKAFDYYNMAVVDGNNLYTNSGTTLTERSHITLVRQRNKILNLANQDVALRAQGKNLYVYNYAGNSTVGENGLEDIRFVPNAPQTQAVAIRRSESEIVLLSTMTGTFTFPAKFEIVSASKGYFDKDNKWVNEGAVTLSGNTLTMPATSAVLVKLKTTEEPITGVIKNPSFEETIYNNGTYTVPKDWTLQGTINGPDVQLKTGDAVDGEKRYYIWATSGSSIDLYQDIVLPAGDYTVKASLKANAPASTYVYATVGGNTIRTATSASWSLWRSTAASFKVSADNTTVRIGVTASEAVMIDHFLLYKKTEGADVSAPSVAEDRPELQLINCEGGILISSNNPELLSVHIHSIAGQYIKTISLSNEPVFVSLPKGAYAVGAQTALVN